MDVLLHYEEPLARHWPFVDKGWITGHSERAAPAAIAPQLTLGPKLPMIGQKSDSGKSRPILNDEALATVYWCCATPEPAENGMSWMETCFEQAKAYSTGRLEHHSAN